MVIQVVKEVASITKLVLEKRKDSNQLFSWLLLRLDLIPSKAHHLLWWTRLYFHQPHQTLIVPTYKTVKEVHQVATVVVQVEKKAQKSRQRLSKRDLQRGQRKNRAISTRFTMMKAIKPSTWLLEANYTLDRSFFNFLRVLRFLHLQIDQQMPKAQNKLANQQLLWTT